MFFIGIVSSRGNTSVGSIKSTSVSGKVETTTASALDTTTASALDTIGTEVVSAPCSAVTMGSGVESTATGVAESDDGTTGIGGRDPDSDGGPDADGGPDPDDGTTTGMGGRVAQYPVNT